MKILACPDCDLLQLVPELSPGEKASCLRCDCLLATRLEEPVDLPLALTIAAAVVFITTQLTPLMSLSAVGRFASTTIAGGARQMWIDGERITAVIVAFCAIIAPAVYLISLLTILLAVRRPPAPAWVGEMLRGAEAMRGWSMNEVMLLGLLVALIKIAELAQVIADVGIYGMAVLVILFPAIMTTFDPEEIWNRVRWADGSLPRVADAPKPS